MTQAMDTRQRKKFSGTTFPWGRAFVALVFVLLVGWIMLITVPPGRWRFIAPPPVPPYALSRQLFYPSNDVERDIDFTTDRPAAVLRQFYRAELAKQGWRYQCAQPVDPPCGPSGMSPEDAMMDVYTREGHSPGQGPFLEIFIEKPGMGAAGDTRKVRIRECCLPDY